MASIIREVPIDAPAGVVWEAVRDVGNPHTRLVRGVLRDARLDGDLRHVTFANGFEVDERIVSIDDEHRRFVYTAINGRSTHHNASMQVVEDGPERCQLIWITDLLPNEVAEPVRALVEQGAAAMQATFAREV